MIVKPSELLKTIYLGDRACKAVLVDSWKKEVAIQVDIISRIRSPPGPLPNDFIHDINVTEMVHSRTEPPLWLFVVSVDSVDDTGRYTAVSIEIQAEGVHLRSRQQPEVEIRS